MQLDVKGEFVPIVLAQLEPTDEIFCEGGLLVYCDPSIKFGTRWLTQGGLGGVLKRSLLGGIPFHQHVYQGPGSAAFSRFRPGEMRVVELGQGEVVDVAEHSLLVASGPVGYTTFYVAGTGRIGRLVGFWMDRLTGPGRIAIQGHGSILAFTLKQGEAIDIDHGALLLKDASVTVKAFNQPLGSGLMGHALSFEALHAEGPGRLWLQTVDPTHAPAGGTSVGAAGASG